MYSLLTAFVLLAVGSVNVWAQDAYETVYTRALAQWTADDLTDWNASSAVEINATNGLGANANLTATYVKKTFDIKDNAKVKYEVDWTYATATGRTGNWNWIQFGDNVRIAINSSYNMQVSTDAGANWNATALGYYYNGTYTKHIEVVFDTQLKKVDSFIWDGTDYTSLVSGTLNGAFNTLSIGFVRGGSVGWTLANYLTNVTVSQAEQAAVATADYSVNYIFNGEIIKSVEGSEAIGATISAESPITINDVKYFAVEGSTMSMELVEGTNTLNITLRQAETYNYTVKNNLGSVITTGSVVEGESATIAYPQYIEMDGVLYLTSTRNATGDGYYLYKITPTQDGEELTIDYAESIANVVYYSEGEDIEGATANNGGNANIRCSNAYGAYFGEDVTVTTLPAGTYKIGVQVWGNTGVTFNVNAGETTVLAAATTGSLAPVTSEPFTLTEETTITIPAAGSNGKVIDWIYIQKVPATYNYSVVSNLGTTIAEGSVSEGESVTFTYSEYILQDGTLYRTSLRNATGNGFYKYTLTPIQDGEEMVIEYNPAIEDVVYFSEAENIEGASANNRNNTDIRCSNALGATFPEDVTIATLPAGAYKFGVQVWGNPGTTFEIKAGESTIMEAATVGYLNAYTKDIVLTEEADIVIAAGGANGKVIDWVYIQRVGDIPTYDVNISSVGYATFYDSKYSYEIPAGVTAKTYTLAEDGIVMNESKTYAEGDVLPADEAVVLEGAQGTYTFNYAATEEAKDENNVLKGTDEATTLNEEGFKYYVLSVKGGDRTTVGFYFQNEDGTALNNGAHKAYLQVADAAEAKAFYVLNGEATAINGVVAAEDANNEVFDLQGRRVAAPAKGLYIMNGKKVVLK